jgi:DNA-directed RNA polymerase subunit E'/Rpb7
MSYYIMLVSPYKNITQYSKIQIKPNQMNSDIQNIIKLVLRKKVEKKCNKNGFIDEVYRIEESGAMDMEPENLSGCCNFRVSYHCRICIPVEETQIVVQIKNLNQVLILAVNGPIMIFIPKENIDLNKWDIYDSFLHKKSKEVLKVNSFVKVTVLKSRINQEDYQIKVIGKLIDFATEEEITQYYGNIIESNDEESIDDNINQEGGCDDSTVEDNSESDFELDSDIFI